MILPLLQTSSCCCYLLIWLLTFLSSQLLKPEISESSQLLPVPYPASRCLINSVGSTFEISLKPRLFFSTLPPTPSSAWIWLLYITCLDSTAGASQISFLRKLFPHPIHSTLCPWNNTPKSGALDKFLFVWKSSPTLQGSHHTYTCSLWGSLGPG